MIPRTSGASYSGTMRPERRNVPTCPRACQAFNHALPVPRRVLCNVSVDGEILRGGCDCRTRHSDNFARGDIRMPPRTRRGRLSRYAGDSTSARQRAALGEMAESWVPALVGLLTTPGDADAGDASAG